MIRIPAYTSSIRRVLGRALRQDERDERDGREDADPALVCIVFELHFERLVADGHLHHGLDALAAEL